jgi:succinate dehydrogenase/fumarate reductase flavoprotein subunit
MDSVDVAVAGAGMAGLTAALAASERGATVAVFEKSTRAGGNAAVSAGMLLGARDYEALRRYIPEGDPELQRMLCAEIFDAIDWLAAHDLPIGAPMVHGEFRVSRPMGLGAPANRAVFMETLADRVVAAGGTIEYSASVTGLKRNGATLTVESATRTVAARALVIATGGFQANRELIARYIGADAAESLRIRSRPEATGDGLALALAQGAATSRNMAAFYGHTMADCPLPITMYQPLTPYFARAGILLNRDGRRFVDETTTFIEEGNAQAACHQPGGAFYLVFDRRMYDIDRAPGGERTRTQAEDWLETAARFGVPLWTAETVDGLIAQLAEAGLPARAVEGELAAYNAACRAGTADRLDPPRANFRWPLEKPPFHALRCVPGITGTSGGIAVDPDCRVLDASGKPLPALFAAGIDAGGVYGKHYGGFLGWSLVSGRKAGRSAAASIGRN